MFGVFDKAGEQLKKGRNEQEFDTVREARAFRTEYASKVAARSESDYDVLDMETFAKVA